MQPMAVGQRGGDVIRVYKCLTKGRENLWRVVPGYFMRIQEDMRRGSLVQTHGELVVGEKENKAHPG